MNRTTATCIAGTRSKTTSRTRIHFLRPREAKPFTRFPRPRGANPFTRRFFAFGTDIFAKRPLGRTERNPLS